MRINKQKEFKLVRQPTNLSSDNYLNKGNVRIIDREVYLRKPRKEDGPLIWALIRDTGVLDLNSAYCYLMLCEFFPETCVLAESGDEIVGFVSAFRPPNKPDAIFVWQVAIAESQRGKKLGTTLLKELLERDACADVRYMEATVSPSNIPSQFLFRGLARDLETHCEIFECFPAEMFPGNGHEAEWTYRIGPINRKLVKN